MLPRQSELRASNFDLQPASRSTKEELPIMQIYVKKSKLAITGTDQNMAFP